MPRDGIYLMDWDARSKTDFWVAMYISLQQQTMIQENLITIGDISYDSLYYREVEN